MTNHQLSILALVLAIIAGISTGVGAYLLAHLPLVWQISAGVAVASLLAHFVLARSVYADIFSRRTTRYGLNSAIMSLIVLGIVIFINMIANEYNWKKDLTKNQIHSLSEQSIKILKGLKQEIRIKAFISPTQIGEFQNIFDKYGYYSKNLKKEFVDFDREPLMVKQYGIKQPGTLVIESDTRNSKVENLMGPEDPKLEEKITNAIISVAKGEKKKMYYTTGHGERLMTDTGREGFSEIKESLEGGRFSVNELSLLEKGAVPPDAELVLVAAPKSDFMEAETKALENYLLKGGKVLFMVEPTSTPTAQAFLAKFGVLWKPKRAVLERNQLQQLAGGNPLTPVVTKYDPGHEITRDAKQLSIFPIAAPVEKDPKAPAGMTVVSLFSSSQVSLEAEIVGDKVKVDQKKDRQGPLSMAVAVNAKVASAKPSEPEKKDGAKPEDDKTPEYRLVVVGDADFASNSVRKFGINGDLFQNMLAWLSHEEDLISIRPKPADSSEFEITEERSRIINLASIIFAPLAMFIAGIITFVTRRRM